MTSQRIPYYIVNPEFQYFLKLDCILVCLLVTEDENHHLETITHLYPRSNLWHEGYLFSIIGGNDTNEIYDNVDTDIFIDKYDRYYTEHCRRLAVVLKETNLYKMLRNEYNNDKSREYMQATIDCINSYNNDSINGPVFIRKVFG